MGGRDGIWEMPKDGDHSWGAEIPNECSGTVIESIEQEGRPLFLQEKEK